MDSEDVGWTIIGRGNLQWRTIMIPKMFLCETQFTLDQIHTNTTETEKYRFRNLSFFLNSSLQNGWEKQQRMITAAKTLKYEI